MLRRRQLVRFAGALLLGKMHKSHNFTEDLAQPIELLVMHLRLATNRQRFRAESRLTSLGDEKRALVSGAADRSDLARFHYFSMRISRS